MSCLAPVFNTVGMLQHGSCSAVLLQTSVGTGLVLGQPPYFCFHFFFLVHVAFCSISRWDNPS